MRCSIRGRALPALMLLAYVSQCRTFRILSEKEFAGGYCDLFLGLSRDVAAARFAWMLEVKYLRTEATGAEIERAVRDAHAQLDRYTSDIHLVALLTLGKELKAGALVFVGAKALHVHPWPPAPRPPARRKAPPKRAAKRSR